MAFSVVSSATVSLAMIMDDPDAPRGPFTHWTWRDLPAAAKNLARGADMDAQGAREGTTGADNAGYTGPCPPGGTHRYFLKLYAVNATLGLAAGDDRSALENDLVGHVLAWGERVVTYARS